jgi:hypothetical protein
MPAHALVHFPKIDTTSINGLREEYDPFNDLIDVHIAIIFPVAVGREALERHISEVLAGWNPFTIRLKGLHLSFDQWLFLTVGDGNENLIRLFEAMYTGLMAPHRRHDIEYIPHIGLGYFGMETYDLTIQSVAPLDEARYNEALRRAEAANLDFETRVDRLTLMELDNEFTKTALLREFLL